MAITVSTRIVTAMAVILLGSTFAVQAAAAINNWTVVDMKLDWKRIFPEKKDCPAGLRWITVVAGSTTRPSTRWISIERA